MEIRHLRYFLAVAEAGHMTRAAEGLGMQQPPLSQQIKALEQELGMSLFRRHPRGVALTDGGRRFQAEAAALLQSFDAMQQRMARVAQGLDGLLAVGFTSSSAAHAFIPDALRAYRRDYASVELSLHEHNAAELTEAVAAGRLHAALLRVPVARPEGVQFETLLREPVVAALPREHPLAVARAHAPGKPVTLMELCGAGLILVRRPGAPGLYGNLLALCEARGLQPRVVAEVERMMTNLNLVAAGVGVSVVPASMAGAQRHAVVYCPLADGGRLDAPLTLLWRKDQDSLPTAHFVALLRRMAGPPPVGQDVAIAGP